MIDIDKFILQQQGQKKITYILKAIFKSNEFQEIYNIKNASKYKLEGLVYFLNEKLIKNKNMNNNNIITKGE